MGKTKFQTAVDIPRPNWETGYSMKNLFMGSCFTENIGGKMAASKYNVNINPFGILYNPVSIASGLQILMENRTFQAKDLVEYGGLWHSFSHHGKFSGVIAEEVLSQINSEVVNSANFLRTADFLFVTFGTAWVYYYRETGSPVSNCHKIPARKFFRSRLTVDEIVSRFSNLFPEIWKINPNIKIVFTVSPIRHRKDGAIENQRSKATLILAIDQLVRDFGDRRCYYFPAYEIMMDELRDYRFYADDMVHISQTGINYIWEIFQETFIEQESVKLSARVDKVMKATEHKPFNKNTAEYLDFIDSTLKQISGLESQFANINFELEKEYFIVEKNEFRKNNEHF